MPIIDLHNVSAGYDDEIILRDVNLTIEPLDFIGVIGPNGGGKTTLAKLILGLIKPISGEVIVSDKIHIGYLPQTGNTDRKFPVTAFEVVLSGLMSQKGFIGRYSREDKEKAGVILNTVGMSQFANKNAGELSGGQMQRILLARAIISTPQLLILDEPDTFVDNKFEHDLYELLKQLNKQMAILMVSHDVGTITTYVKTIACVNRNLHYHPSNIITQDQLEAYNCPIQLITHGHIPHTVLGDHNMHHHHD